MKKKSAIVDYLLSFLLTLTVAGLIVGIGSLLGPLRNETVRTALVKTEYYQHVQEEIQEEIQALFLASGLDESLLEDAVTQDVLYPQIKGYIEGSLDGGQPSLDTMEFRKILSDNIEKYLRFQGIGDDIEEMQDGIDILLDSAEEKYCSLAGSNLFQYFAKFRDAVYRIVTVATGALALILFLLCVCLCIRHRTAYHGCNYIAYGWLAGSLLGLLPFAVILATKVYTRISISTVYFHDFVTEYLRSCLWQYIGVAIVFLVFYVVLLLAIISMRKKEHKR
ncbi:MAG: hypothetical protein ACI4CT_04910 [Lachnospiraceae bacterium]